MTDVVAAPGGAAPARPLLSSAIQAECWGEPETIRPHLTARAPLRVLDYWSQLRGSRRFPPRVHFNPMKVARLLPKIFLVDVLPDGGFRYRVAGALISDFFGVANPAGMTPEQVFGADAEVAISPMRICSTERASYMHSASANWRHGDRTYVYYEMLLLPFGEGDDAVTSILCCAEFVCQEDIARV